MGRGYGQDNETWCYIWMQIFPSSTGDQEAEDFKRKPANN